MAVSNPRIVQIFETSLSEVCGCTQLMYNDVYVNICLYTDTRRYYIYYYYTLLLRSKKLSRRGSHKGLDIKQGVGLEGLEICTVCLSA